MTRRRPQQDHADDERRLLEAAWAAFEEAIAEDAPLPTPPASARDRVLLQNWNAEPSSVRIGDIDLELEPGQSVTLWLKPTQPVPPPVEGSAKNARDLLAILAKDDPPIC